MIDEIVKYIKNLTTNDTYIKEFDDNIFFGSDNENNAIFAQRTASNEKEFTIKTSTFILKKNVNYEFVSDDGTIEDKFNVIIFFNKCFDSLYSFVSLCVNFYSRESNKDITELTSDMISIFKNVDSDSHLYEQEGLWGELFTINYFVDKYGINLCDKWHKDAYNKYDFSLTQNKKIEVKTTTNETREHEFSHDQIHTKNEVLISSVLLQKDDEGITIWDLYNRLEKSIDDYDLNTLFINELIKFNENRLCRFNEQYALDNIRFVFNNVVPQYNSDEPEDVRNTKYKSSLEGLNFINDSELVDFINRIDE